MKIDNRQQLLIVLTVAVVALYAGDLLLLEPAWHWWQARSEQVTELRTKVKEGKLLVQRETGIRGHWDQMRTNTLPNSTSLAEQQVLKAFDDWARASGVGIPVPGKVRP